MTCSGFCHLPLRSSRHFVRYAALHLALAARLHLAASPWTSRSPSFSKYWMSITLTFSFRNCNCWSTVTATNHESVSRPQRSPATRRMSGVHCPTWRLHCPVMERKQNFRVTCQAQAKNATTPSSPLTRPLTPSAPCLNRHPPNHSSIHLSIQTEPLPLMLISELHSGVLWLGVGRECGLWGSRGSAAHFTVCINNLYLFLHELHMGYIRCVHRICIKWIYF